MPLRRFVVASFALSIFVFASGCGGYVGRARKDYSDGRYLEAAERLGQHEADVYELSPRRQAEYGIYRGLSLMMLGDFAGAHQWLSFAYEVERQSPGTLKPEQRAELDRGWAQLGAALAAPRVVPPGAVVVPGPIVPGEPSREPPPAEGASAP